MICPICLRVLVKKYRVVRKIKQRPCYVPIWVCIHHKFSVEINRLSKHVVDKKPKPRRPKPPLGSAAD